MQPNCETCQHFSSINATDGLCRVNPPAIGNDGRAVWPVVLVDDQCGKYAE